MCTMEIRTLDPWVRSQRSTTEPTWQVYLILLSYLTYPNKKLGRYFVAPLPGVRGPVGALPAHTGCLKLRKPLKKPEFTNLIWTHQNDLRKMTIYMSKALYNYGLKPHRCCPCSSSRFRRSRTCCREVENGRST